MVDIPDTVTMVVVTVGNHSIRSNKNSPEQSGLFFVCKKYSPFTYTPKTSHLQKSIHYEIVLVIASTEKQSRVFDPIPGLPRSLHFLTMTENSKGLNAPPQEYRLASSCTLFQQDRHRDEHTRAKLASQGDLHPPCSHPAIREARGCHTFRSA